MRSPSPLESGRIVLITGGSSGIGLAAAKRIAKLGCHVWLAARREELLRSAVSQLEVLRQSPSQVFGYTSADISIPAQAQRVASEVVQAVGVPDVVINSAAIAEAGYFYELPLEAFKSQIDINYLGMVYLIKALVPDMMERRSGTIVNITSLAGAIGLIGYTAYGASKFAVRGFTEALRSELKPYGILVILVYPPDTDTPQLAHDIEVRPPETSVLAGAAKVKTPEEVAGVIIQGIQHRRTLIIPGLDSKFLHRLIGFMGDGIFPVIDFIISRARKNQVPPPKDGGQK